MAQTMPLCGLTNDDEECNQLSMQNCGADTPLVCAQPPSFASNDDLVTGGVATASTALTRPVTDTTVEPMHKRRQKPSQKACENADDSAARASRLKRTNRAAQVRECDFSHPNSVNKCFPHYRGKGKHNVPQSLIDACSTAGAKAKVVREWRNLTSNQQKAKIEAVKQAKKETKSKNRKRSADDRAKGREKSKAKQEESERKRQERQSKRNQQRREDRAEAKRKKVSVMHLKLLLVNLRTNVVVHNIEN